MREIFKVLKNLAMELQIPVLALSQISRAAEQRKDPRSILSDRAFMDAGENVDTLMFLCRDDYDNPDTDKKGIAEVDIVKCKNGGTGKVELAWNPENKRYTNLT